ncbi:MAG: aminotransferase class I/II-fold pyridoxal phosphate-dependent enzyme [Clostridiales bacterium]|nr:aminotransferase class I/II-fold pyridoxal phosphate-dependent enzyme [Clostridiales bacterium]
MTDEWKEIHGGDIYRNRVEHDFSVNINPFGMPETVREALHKAVENCSAYPDSKAEQLKAAVGEMSGVPKEYLLFGNGASELFMAVIHGIHPNRIVIPVPSFYGYEYAAESVRGEILFYEMKEDNAFAMDSGIFSVLTENTDLLFLANPNNPTGQRMSRTCLEELLCHCREKGIYVVLDECFVEFCGEEFSMMGKIDLFDNLILVRAFTKLFSIPGVRLGYLVCSNRILSEQIRRQLPEWNLSSFAQAAGCACAGQIRFIKQTEDFVKEERKFLEEGLKKMGLSVFPGEANFILFYSDYALYERLLERKILIRDCGNFRGLYKGFYRIAVKSREENEILLKAMGEILWE